jgi:hypothetical protein
MAAVDVGGALIVLAIFAATAVFSMWYFNR